MNCWKDLAFFLCWYGRNLWKFYLFEIVYLHCLSIGKQNCLHLSFFFLLLSSRYYCHFKSNTHRRKNRYLSSSYSLLRTFFSSFTNSRRFLSKYPLFSSLCLIKLCVNCVRFHRTFLSLSLCSDAVWKRQMASLLYTCVYSALSLSPPSSSSPSFKYFGLRIRRKYNPSLTTVIKFRSARTHAHTP